MDRDRPTACVFLFPGAFPHLLPDGQRLLEVLQRLLPLAEGVVYPSDVVERRRKSGPVPHLLHDGQRTLGVLQRLITLAEGVVDHTDVVERHRLACAIADLARESPEGLGLLEVRIDQLVQARVHAALLEAAA